MGNTCATRGESIDSDAGIWRDELGEGAEEAGNLSKLLGRESSGVLRWTAHPMLCC